MKIVTKAVWNIETGTYLERVGYDYCGPIELACGASQQQKDAFQNEKKISDMLTTQLSEFAGNNLAILREIQGNLTPIQSAGPQQFGFAPAEESALRTGTAEQLNAAGAQTANAVRGAIASRGGGTNFLPSGSEAAIIGSLAQDTAVKEAEAQSAITAKGYDIGRQNWEFATEGLMKAPGELESPVNQAGSVATGAAGQEMQGGTEITQANQAWMQPVGALAGGVIKGFLPGKGSSGGGGGDFGTPQGPNQGSGEGP
jgi:hypothetical protein